MVNWNMGRRRSDQTGAARQAITDAMNGDVDSIDPAVRRALVALATQHDSDCVEQSDRWEQFKVERTEIVNNIVGRYEDEMERLDRRITVLTRLLVSTSVTLLTTTVAAALAIAF